MRIIVAAVLGWVLSGGAVWAEPQTGTFQISATSQDLMGEAQAEQIGETVAPGEALTWDVVVPDQYDPQDPPGVLIYISPTPEGRSPGTWKSVFADENLIWVGADNSGNRVKTRRRIMLAILGLIAIQKDYETDNRRIYLSGFSGGGRTASEAMAVMPQMFRGAIYFSGTNFVEGIASGPLALFRDNAYVFITGRNDFNRRDTKNVHRKYRRMGAERLKLMDLPYLGHELPRSGDLAEAIEFLDLHRAEK